MKPFLSICLLTALAVASSNSYSEVKVHILDSGPGLATVIELPDNGYILYDTGHWNETGRVLDRVKDIIPESRLIDMIVLSHTDSDHISATDLILDTYSVDTVMRTGLERTSNTWKRVDKEIRLAAADGELEDWNLKNKPLQPGTSYLFGDAIVTFLSGFYKPPKDWDIENSSEYNNAGSIVMRVEYKGKSVLFMGDALGRHNRGSANQLIATEKFLIENSSALVIDSDVLIASHHGADNGSAKKFIEAVSPEWVIFSAGHDHEHPRESTAQRFLDYGVDLQKILRTDLGDDEGGPEWSHGRRNGRTDPAGDDDIEITISGRGVLSVVQN